MDALPTRKVRVNINGSFVEKETFDYDKLERETVGNVIVNCLANYKIKDKREGFYCNMIAQAIIGETGDVVLKENSKHF